MILQEGQRVNVVVRGLIFNDDHLLLTQWRDDGVAFPIGGRVEFGEPLVETLRREVQEETGTQVTAFRLVYFAENLFTTEKGGQFHEYGWYFRVEVDRPVCALNETIPNPDHPDLVIRYLALDKIGSVTFWPPFLPRYLPSDWAQGFIQNPRYIYCRQNQASTIEVQELAGLFEHRKRDLPVR
jgi:8-oxo-dGTP pyrophosphatase MutT (NUDIX family)